MGHDAVVSKASMLMMEAVEGQFRQRHVVAVWLVELMTWMTST